ncbi:protein S40-1 [Cannabis sativa]|uniref:protein S40-1 n=1 Tax=Cannabis sativa TaxID=3483 RepID=UPI0029CA09B9|nr:protein S40-1 [Cannabis sativa]
MSNINFNFNITMGEEFEESEVIFYEEDHHHQEMFSINNNNINTNHLMMMRSKNKSKNKKGNKIRANSMPMNIPREEANLFRNINDHLNHEIWNNFDDDNYDYDYDYDENEELVPPHVIVRRRLAGGKMAFSVCSGNGRTLKGRDLSHVRNSILRMTGFLEA